jgi:ribose 5-phosphate isomerase B
VTGPVDRERIRRMVIEALDARAGDHRAPRESGRGAGKTIAVGADHGGFQLKAALARYLGEELGWRVVDHGTHSEEAVDYPDVALPVALAVARGDAAYGLLIDGAGIGSTMAANKVRGVRAALCHDERTARNAREHNDANVLALGAGSVQRGLARRIVRIFVETPFAGGRHERRVAKIMAIEAPEAGREGQRGGGS